MGFVPAVVLVRRLVFGFVLVLALVRVRGLKLLGFVLLMVALLARGLVFMWFTSEIGWVLVRGVMLLRLVPAVAVVVASPPLPECVCARARACS